MNPNENTLEPTLPPSLEDTQTAYTASASQTESETDSKTLHRGRQQLIENYRALLREKVIYYPVCYRFERLLGRGRQSSVFLAQRQGARGCLTHHAIKVFDPGIYSNAKKYWTDMGRIASQLSILGGIRSTHLAALDSYEEINGIGYVQMEQILGTDLRYLLNGTHLNVVKNGVSEEEWSVYMNDLFQVTEGDLSIQPGVAVYIMRMMLKGLEDLHEAGFVHSDLKPSNTMISRRGYVKLIDFGRAVKPKEKVSILLGSPLYMAPEIHRREASLIQSDIYGVGMVGLEMLRGRPLVDFTEISEAKLLDFKMTLPERLEGLLPERVRQNKEFVDLLRRFVDPDPARRFSSALEAEHEHTGLRQVHRQLVKTGQDTDYARLLGDYMVQVLALTGK